MENTENNTYSGIGFCGLLTIAFIILKLCNVITWTWVWVLSPLWISFALGVLIILIAWWQAVKASPLYLDVKHLKSFLDFSIIL